MCLPGLRSNLSLRTSKIFVIGSLIICILRWVSPERHVDYVGPRAILDDIFALWLLSFVILLAFALGQKVFRWLKLKHLTQLEQSIFQISIGLGILAYGVLLLGLVGVINSWSLFLLLMACGLFCSKDIIAILSEIPTRIPALTQTWQKLEIPKKLLILAIGIILLLTTAQALTPPTDPDSQIYHLQAPKLYLEEGKIYPTPELSAAAYPLTVEMLFALGLAFGSDTFAKLIHLSFGILLALSIYAFGLRYLSSRVAWIAVAIFVGIPIIPVWASLAYVDLGWALFEFHAVYLLIAWLEERNRNTLVLSALFISLAVGSKYRALFGAVIFGFILLWGDRDKGWRKLLSDLTLFGSILFCVGGVWYIKNWFWYGNPAYPFFAGLFQSGDRALASMMADNSRNLIEYLLLPINLYLHHDQYATVYGTIEFPSLLFLLVFLYPWTRRKRIISLLAIVTAFRFLFWSLITARGLRYLLPVFPALSLISASVAVDLINCYKIKRVARPIIFGTIGGMVAVTVVYSVLYFLQVQPFGVVMGWLSKQSFLNTNVSDYSAMSYITTNIPADSRVFMLWDSRGYYCDDRCMPDLMQTQWVSLVVDNPDISAIATKLKEKGVTHILINYEDLGYKIYYDRSGIHSQAMDFFELKFRPACTREVYKDRWVNIFEFTCD